MKCRIDSVVLRGRRPFRRGLPPDACQGVGLPSRGVAICHRLAATQLGRGRKRIQQVERDCSRAMVSANCRCSVFLEVEYQTRCARGACTRVVAWTVSANLEATCYWRLCFCPKLYLTLQKELVVQPGIGVQYLQYFQPVAALFAWELAQGGPHTLP